MEKLKISQGLRKVLLNLFVCVLYVLFAQLTNLTVINPGQLKIIWLAPAFAIFVVFTFGYAMLWGIGIGAFVYYWGLALNFSLSSPVIVTALAATLLVLAHAFVFVFVAKRWFGEFPEKPAVSYLYKILGVSIVLSTIFPIVEYLLKQTCGIGSVCRFSSNLLHLYWGTVFSTMFLTPLFFVIGMKWQKKSVVDWVPRLISGLGIGLTVVLVIIVSVQESANLQSNFDQASNNLSVEIQHVINQSYHDILVSEQFFDREEYISREEFTEFTAPFLENASHSSGLFGIGWVPQVVNDERTIYEKRAMDEGFEDFEIFEVDQTGEKIRAEQRSEYFPLYYFQSVGNSDEWIGYDLGKSAEFSELINRVNKTGSSIVAKCAAVGPGNENPNCYMLLLPLFSPNTSQTNVLLGDNSGYLIGIFDLAEWVNIASQRMIIGKNVKYLFDMTNSMEIKLRLPTQENQPDEFVDLQILETGIYHSSTLKLLNQEWLFVMKPSSEYVAARRTILPWVVLFSGLLITILLTAYIETLRRNSAAIQKNRERYEHLVGNVIDFIWILDVTDNQVIYASPSGEGMLGYAQEEFLGKKPDFFLSFEARTYLREEFPDRLEKYLQGEEYAYFDEIAFVNSEDEVIFTETSTIAFRNPENGHIELFGVSRDITRRKEAEDALKQNQAILKATQRISKVGGWEWKVAEKSMYWTDEVYRIHDMDMNLVHDDTIQIALESMQCYPSEYQEQVRDAFLRCQEDGEAFDLVLPFTTKKGRNLWVRTTGHPVWEDGKIVKVLGNMMDITERKLVEDALRKSEGRLNKIFELMPVGLWFADETGKLIQGNSAGIRIWGGEPKVGVEGYGVFKARRLPSGEEIVPDDWALAHTIRDGVTIKNELLEIESFDGQKKIILNFTAPVIGEKGEVIGAIVVNQDITDMKRMEQALAEERNSLVQRVKERTAELRKSNANLEKALTAKDEFLANMSHELRTPLTAILGLSEMLTTEVHGGLKPRQKKYLNTIYQSGEHLLALINDILDISKAAAGKLELQYSLTPILDLCVSSMSLIRPMAEKKHIQIYQEIENEDLVIEADGRRVRQILVNLLNNAVKFTPENGKVSLEVRSDENAQIVCFVVRDSGIGISEEDFERLFQPFIQLDSGLDRGYEGTGLGLALVRRLVDLHHGSLAVDSSGVHGEGSVFTVRLPIHKADEGQPLVLEPVQQNVSSNKQGDQPGDFDHHQTILLADDNPANVMTISEYLKGIGYDIVIASNGKQAIELVEEYGPDLVLMDIHMPELDGLQAIRILRGDSRYTEMPIFVVTALAMPGDKERSLAAGANEFLTKPIRLKALQEKIKYYFDNTQYLI